MSIYNKYFETIKIYLDLNSTAPQEPQKYRLKINWNWGIFAWWNWSSWKVGEKDETIQCITSAVDKGLIASTVIAGGVSIATFARSVNHLLGKH